MVSNEIEMTQSRKRKVLDYKIIGFPLPMFLILSIVVMTAIYMEVLPNNIIGAMASTVVIGAIFNEIGNKTPIIKDYLGGGAIVVIFGSASLATYNILPETTIETVSSFMSTFGWLDFYIAALLTGSILGMSRKLLIKAAVRYLPAIFGAVIAAGLAIAIVGALIGFGAVDGILMLAIPLMGGGMGAGAVPIAQVYAGPFNMDADTILSMIVPAVALGNAVAIVSGGLLNRLGKAKPSLTGNGKLMVHVEDADEEEEEEKFGIDFKLMGMGLFLSTVFFAWGSILGEFITFFHPYALMIITVAIIKAFGIMPRKYEIAANQWFQFMMSYLTSALLVGIGIEYTDLNQIIESLSFTYLLLVIVGVVGAMFGAAVVGKFMGFYPIEAAITAGLCMANMGGTGDVATLSAADRMELMPFSQISSRIGGAIMLIIASIAVNLLL